ncbi:Homeodomain-like protein [Mycena vulgaris]|nr:Homeodomain-like protein [Mycena vulgaris]
MTRGRPLSQDLRWSLLKMARTHDIATISKLTGVGKRTIERLMSDYRKYGTAARWGPGRSLRGQKRKLSTQNVEFLRGYIRFRNDPYLQELKDALEERVGVEVSDTTVWRTLTRTGFTMKKVRSSLLSFVLHQTCFSDYSPCH